MKTTRRRAPAKRVQDQCGSGSLSRPEITKLVLAARDAYRHQMAQGQVAGATTFDAWRRDQVMTLVGLPGISKLHRSHFRQVFAHFLSLAGKGDEAFDYLTRTGAKRDHGDPADTYESAEAVVAKIREALADHALVPADKLQPGKGHLHAGWLLAAARQRTSKPSLTMDTLAARLDPDVLVGLLSHLRNHISRREGRENPAMRSPRRYPKKRPSVAPDLDCPF